MENHARVISSNVVILESHRQRYPLPHLAFRSQIYHDALSEPDRGFRHVTTQVSQALVSVLVPVCDASCTRVLLIEIE